MKFFLTPLLCLTGCLLFAQTNIPGTNVLTLERVKGAREGGLPTEMMCDPSSTLQIISCEGEDRNATPPTGDNNPGNGAFMTWVASGSSTGLYYSQLIQGAFTTQIIMGGTNISVFPEEPGGIMDINLAIGGNTTNECLSPGTWTVRVWEVLDDNNDGSPDVDAAGDIIGCFTECTFTFLPSCPISQPFDIDVTDVGCTNGGSINLINFDPSDVYCDGQATFSWSGPGGFSSSNQDISNLATGTYTFQLTDFYGCTTGPITVDVGIADPVMATCGNPQAPSVFGASDGSFDVDITVGEGDYTISWAGPTSGSNSGNDGVNTITGLPAGDYDILITDNVTGCTTTCTLTIPDPPCEMDFEVSLDNIGNVILTITGGQPDYFVNISSTTTPPQDNLGPYTTSPILLSANLFEAGDYVFTVYEADRPDCLSFREFTIEGPDCSDFGFTVENFVDLNCGGINDGAIEISLSGGTNPVLTWVNGPGVAGSNDLSISNLGPGTYYFQATDDEGCVLEETFELVAPAELLFDCSGVPESCTDANDGSIGVSIAGGSPPFTLSYSAQDPGGNPLPGLTNFTVADGDSLFNLSPGTYDLAVEDANGCVVTCSTMVDEVVCPNVSFGGADQTVLLDSIMDATIVNGTGGVVLAFGGTPDWTYAISSTTGGLDTIITTAFSPDTAINLPIDTYNLTLIRAIDTVTIDSTLLDSLGVAACCLSPGAPPMFDFIIRGPECMIALAPTTGDPQCFAEPSGFIDLNVTGAIGNITVEWSPPSLSGTTPGGLLAGVYSVTVTDEAGCSVDGVIELFDPPPVTVDLAADQVLCAGDSTATITATVTDAQGAVSYQWFPSGPDAPTLPGVPAGDYSVIITDAAGCTDTAAITVTEVPAIVLNCDAIAETNVGTADGQVFFDLSGGTPPYTFELNNLTVTRPALDTFRNLAPGEYTIEVFDANNCSTTCTAVVNPGGCGDFSLSLDLSQPDCDSATGTATVTPLLANGMVTYQWEHGPTTASLTDLTAGNYSVTATDAFSCTAVQEFTVTAFTDFPGLIVGDFATICADECAEIDLVLTGPAPITVHFTVEQAGTQVQGQVDGNDGPLTLTFCPADYGLADLSNVTVTIDSLTANNGCTRSINETRSLSLFPPSLGTVDPVICATDTFRLNGEVFHANRTTGDVVLSGASANGCDSTVSVNLSFFAPATGAVDPVICATDTFRLNGEVFHANRTTGDVVLSGASANGCDSTVSVNLSFFAPATGAVNPVICATDTFRLNGEVFHANRTTGDVVLSGASANGCDSTVSVNLSFFAPATGAVDPVICATDTFRLNGEVFHANRTTGDVVLSGASANGCDSTVSVNLSFFAPATGAVDPVICATDTFRLNGEAFHANRTTGDVVLPGASANGCDSTVSVNLSFFAPATGAVDPVICATDTFRLNGEVFHANRTTGDVVLSGASANGCDSTVTVNLSFFAPATGAVDPVICATDTFRLNGEAFHANRTTGDVVLPGASANGCDSTVSVTVTFFAPAAAALTPTICATDTFFLAGQAFHAARTSGDVVLAGASSNGCDSTISVNVDFFPQTVAVFDTTICTGTSFSYGGRVFDRAVSDTLITLPIPTANGCDSLVAVTVRERAVPTVSIDGEGVVCDDGLLSISISYDGPAEANVSLSSNPGEVISLVSGTTTIQRPVDIGETVTIVSAEDGGPCALLTSGSITVTASDMAVQIDVMSGDGIYAVSCAGGSDGEIMALPSGGVGPFVFDWNTGDDTQVVEDLPAGEYSLIATSGRGCQASASVQLTEPDVLAVQIGEIDATCLDANPALVVQNVAGGVGPYLLSVDGGNAFRPLNALPDTATAQVGITNFVLEDSKGCALSQSFEFDPAPVGEIQITPTYEVITLGDSVEIAVLTNLEASGYQVVPGPETLLSAPSFFVAPDTTTRYLITAIDDAGCTVSGEALIVVDRFVPLFAPSAFSPNQDGTNDVYRIYGTRNVVSFSDFSIFDRWGNRVYDFAGPVGPRDENWGWDGRTIDGRLRQSGAYVFSVTVTFTDGSTKVVKGDLVLVR